MRTNIYALVDPRDDKIRYVGKANDVNQRLKNHLNPARYRPTHKFNWIRKLRKLGLKPYLIILDEVENEDWKFWEKWWLAMCKSWGFDLVNYTEGGDGLTYGNQTSFKKGHIPWNNGTAKPKILKGNRGKTEENIKNQFKKNHLPWNKTKKGYSTTKRKPILQFSLDDVFIQEFSSCKEAAEKFNCGAENIRNAIVGRSKTAKGFIWKYKNNN